MVKGDEAGCCVLCGHKLPKSEAIFSQLTPVEAKIVSVLLHDNSGRFLRSKYISDQLYSDRPGKPEWANKAVTVHVTRIRAKLGKDCIETHPTPGVGGYRWASELNRQLELF